MDTAQQRRLAALRQHVEPQPDAGGIRQQPTAAMHAEEERDSSAASVWDGVPQAPPDAILSITEAFKADESPNKLNLGVGAYRTEEGRPLVLQCVLEAERRLVQDAGQNKEYLPIGGNSGFCKAAAALAFGRGAPPLAQGRVATVQTLSGTGALRVGAEFIACHYPGAKAVYLPMPTWANHNKIFAAAGLEVRPYRYYAKQGLDYKGLLQDLRGAQRGAVVLLHACAHNPTGADPSPEQWRGILAACRSAALLPFFDSAYQGFASGALDADAAAVRLFAGAGTELLLAQSFAKNMGLYGERVGALSVVCARGAAAERVESQLKQVIRAMYSSPPKHGAAIAELVMSDARLRAQWEEELRGMAERIGRMRRCLHGALLAEGAPGDWRHILDQIGMFSYTGLTLPQVQHLTRRWHVFMTLDGRISMAGLSEARCGYLARAIKDAVTTC